MIADPALRSLAASSRRRGLSLRPPRQLLRLLHLAREYAAAVAFRPISFGNLSYLQERIGELHTLGREIDTMLSALTPAWRERAQQIAGMLARCGEHAGPRGFAAIVHACDTTNYRSFWERSTACIPACNTPALTRDDYDTILIATGPALGLGDEIACAALAHSIRTTWPRASVEAYSFYAGLWQTIEPSFAEHTINGRPLQPFDRIDEIVRTGRHSSTLVLFINFTGLCFHLAYSVDTVRPDIVEIAVGRGAAWFLSGDGGPVQTLYAMDTVYPNNYTALRSLATRLVGTPPSPGPATADIRTRSGRFRNDYRIVINPLTSKPILLTPQDWAALIHTSLTALPSLKPIRCTVLPGLAGPSWDYAQALVAALRSQGVPCTAEVLNGDSPLPSDTAFRKVVRCLSGADLLVGIDTYTAHLAAMLGVPSVALCYERNTAFWCTSADSFWVELRHDIHIPAEVVSTLMALTGASTTQGDLAEWPAVPVPESSEDPLQHFIASCDAAWSALPARVQHLLQELDKTYAWPSLRSWLSSPNLAPQTADWLCAITQQLHFGKLCRLAPLYRRTP